MFDGEIGGDESPSSRKTIRSNCLPEPTVWSLVSRLAIGRGHPVSRAVLLSRFRRTLPLLAVTSAQSARRATYARQWLWFFTEPSWALPPSVRTLWQSGCIMPAWPVAGPESEPLPGIATAIGLCDLFRADRHRPAVREGNAGLGGGG